MQNHTKRGWQLNGLTGKGCSFETTNNIAIAGILADDIF
jgi:hypothetical protein